MVIGYHKFSIIVGDSNIAWSIDFNCALDYKKIEK